MHIETIRYYERINILPKPPRTVGGRRTYYPTHVRLLAFIKRSRDLGFSPDDVRKLLRLGGPDRAPCRQVRDIALDHLNDVRARIAHLRQLERLLAKTVSQCTGTTKPECAVLDILMFKEASPDGVQSEEWVNPRGAAEGAKCLLFLNWRRRLWGLTLPSTWVAGLARRMRV